MSAHWKITRPSVLGLVATLLLVLGAGCAPDAEEIPQRMQRPLLSATTDAYTVFLDAGRAQLFFWDPREQRYVPGRTPVDEEAMGVPIAPGDRVRGQEITFSGLAIDSESTTAAVAYSTGIGQREGYLALLELVALPMTDPSTTDFPISPSAQGPFAVPFTEAGFVVIEPQAPVDGAETPDATWRTLPEDASQSGPRARRLAWNVENELVFAASPVTAAVHVLEWPSLAPVTDVVTDGLPLDIAYDERDGGQLAVITTRSLSLHEGPEYELTDRHPLRGLPWRVLYLQEKADLTAVLNQNGTLTFFDRGQDTLCAVDTQPDREFRAVGLRYIDQPPTSANRLQDIAAVGCRSRIPSDLWRITYEGVIISGDAEHVASGLLVGPEWAAQGVGEGDLLVLDAEGEEDTTEHLITSVDGDELQFTDAAAVPVGQTVGYSVRAAEAWVVSGEEAGFDGRVMTGETFTGSYFRFRLVPGHGEPQRDDRFVFESDGGVEPVRFASPGFDLQEDRTGRLMVPLPNEGLVRAIEVQSREETWTIRTVYSVR